MPLDPVIMKIFYTYPVDSILLLGPTGVGKSPLGDALADNGLFGRQCHHLDFGSELRNVVSGGIRSAAYSKAELEFIHGVLDRGLLLENEHFPLAEKIFSLFLDRVRFSQRDVLILNGIPRHVGQAQDIAKIADIHALIVLACSADDVFCRIRNNIGGDRTERVDDNKELIEKKLSIFRDRTAPLIEHYAQAGSTVYRLGISGTTTTTHAYQALLSLTATHPPISLVAEPPQR
jgi:adenylate kinase family enzyme